jgi:hypothetical protein
VLVPVTLDWTEKYPATTAAFAKLPVTSAYIDGELCGVRKERLAQLLKEPPAGIVYSEHEGGDGEAFRRAACQHGLEGVVSKRIDRPYLPGDRGAWASLRPGYRRSARRSKCSAASGLTGLGWASLREAQNDPSTAEPAPLRRG